MKTYPRYVCVLEQYRMLFTFTADGAAIFGHQEQAPDLQLGQFRLAYYDPHARGVVLGYCVCGQEYNVRCSKWDMWAGYVHLLSEFRGAKVFTGHNILYVTCLFLVSKKLQFPNRNVSLTIQ